MENFTYLDFDLQIDRAGSAYRAQVIDSPAGLARRDFALPFERFELDSFLLRLGRTRRATRRIDTPEVDAARTFGSRLFQAVFDDEVGACLARSLDEATRQNARLRIRLLLKYAPELANLPWEYLYDPEVNRFLALSVNTPLVRYLDLPGRVRPLIVQPPLRALVMISNPTDQDELDVEKEWARLRRAVEPLELRGALTLERLAEPSLAALQRHLRLNQYHIFHYIGHGGFDPGKKDGILVLEDERGRSSFASSEYLGTILHDHSSLRLAILNTCEGARSADDDPFAGTAQSLVQQGIPAVVAMQFEISDDAAIRFANEFYSSLAAGYPVDAAISEARKSIFTQPNPLEWGTPVLFLRAPDGRIFDVAPPGSSAAPRPPLPEPRDAVNVEPVYIRALSAFYNERWGQAVALLEQILAAQPDYKDVVLKHKQAQAQYQLAQLYDRGNDAWGRRAWQDAIAHFEQAQQLDSGFRDVGVRLAEAKRLKALDDLYAEARWLHAANEWQAVLNIFERIHALDAAYPDPDDLLQSARHALEERAQAEKLAAMYAEAVMSIDGGRWADARDQLEAIRAIAPGYEEADGLLERVREKIELHAQQERDAAAAEDQARQHADQEARLLVEEPAPAASDGQARLGKPTAAEGTPLDRQPPVADAAPAAARPAEPRTPGMAATSRPTRRHLMLVLGGFGLLLVVLALFQLKAIADQRAADAASAEVDDAAANAEADADAANAEVDAAATATFDAVSQGLAFMGAPQPTSTALVNYPLYISEDFANNTYIYSGQTWYEGELDDEEWRAALGFREDRYFVDVAEVKQEMQAVLGQTEDDFTDFDVATTIHGPGGNADLSMGLHFRRVDDDNHYFFGIREEREEFYVGVTEEGAWQEDLLLAGTTSDIQAGVPNRLAVRATGSHFSFYVNDTLVGEVEDERFSAGTIAVGIHIPDGAQPFTVAVDDFLLQAPDFTSASTSE